MVASIVELQKFCSAACSLQGLAINLTGARNMTSIVTPQQLLGVALLFARCCMQQSRLELQGAWYFGLQITCHQYAQIYDDII